MWSEKKRDSITELSVKISEISENINRFRDEISNKLGETNAKIKNLEDKITKEMSFMKDQIAFYSTQARGETAPKEVHRVPGGYGLIEPRSTWRRERYGR